MTKKKSQKVELIEVLKVNQWLPEWDKVQFDPRARQSRPQAHYYLFSMKAGHLKALTGVYRRSTSGGKARAKDPNVQRGHEEERSAVIREFVKYGYPWCEMASAKRQKADAIDLRKPGWLPTAIIVNILPRGSERNGIKISEKDLIQIEESSGHAYLRLPGDFDGVNWQPHQVYPMEVIDGQHRLWAFEDFDPGDTFELPVVAFHGLDNGWQAYLFWSVNITPKRINRSLAFDLYPLLRQQTWLDKFTGHSIYRETRCQELVESLWAHPQSPWYQRINMLGERKESREYKGATVSQAAWIRSLMASFVKQWEGAGTRIGGLFGAPATAHDPILPWNRPMQAAFLIHAGIAFQNSIEKTGAEWAKSLRKVKEPGLFKGDDPAFYGEHSLISTDQGVRGFLLAVNDLCYVQKTQLDLIRWRWEDIAAGNKKGKLDATDEGCVTAAIKSIEKTDVGNFIREIGDALSTYDWSSSSTPGLTEPQRLQKSALRGSGGYRELRRQLLLHLAKRSGRIGQSARTVMGALKYT
ncbi:MAG: hypothetical protein A2Y76_12920 [Planctomycetes bacterium RBG_13_60_9]|nr:MAG: hypothetical protein A2Y76_12920 [Planctomycetes bacterium RBG_13_60_9]